MLALLGMWEGLSEGGRSQETQDGDSRKFNQGIQDESGKFDERRNRASLKLVEFAENVRQETEISHERCSSQARDASQTRH